MDNFDRCIAKLDVIIDKLVEARRYNQRTALLVILLWGFGLPLTLLATLIFVAKFY